MDDFSVEGKSNLYGLPPSENNFIKPHKTPQSSTVPTIVTQEGKVVMVTGGAGGSRIPTATIQVLFLYMLQTGHALIPQTYHIVNRYERNAKLASFSNLF